MAYDSSKDYTTKSGVRSKEGGPSRSAFAVTPGGSDLAKYCRAVYIGTSGTLSGIPVDSPTDTVLTFTAVPIGILPVAFRRITAAPAGTIGLL